MCGVLCWLQSPRTPHERVYVLPLLTILTNKASVAGISLLAAVYVQFHWQPGPFLCCLPHGCCADVPCLHPDARAPPAYFLILFVCNVQGTGIVTSVPSDAPDDYAALMDLGEGPPLLLLPRPAESTLPATLPGSTCRGRPLTAAHLTTTTCLRPVAHPT